MLSGPLVGSPWQILGEQWFIQSLCSITIQGFCKLCPEWGGSHRWWCWCFRWWEEMLDRPGVPVHWECLPQSSRSSVFISGFNCISREAGNIKSEWTMFCTSTAKAAAKSCNWKIVGCWCLWQQSQNQMVNIRGEGSHQVEGISLGLKTVTVLYCGTPEVADRYWQANGVRHWCRGGGGQLANH